MAGTRHAHVIVIGGGTMGTAAAWALGRRGVRALVLEQFQHVHGMGSHGGETRIIRHAYAESPEYVPLVRRADQLWQELEAETGQHVLVRCGGVELAAPGFTHARSARASADEHHVPYEWLSPEETSRRWPGFQVPERWDALYSPDSGFLLTEPALRSMKRAATHLGAAVLEETHAITWGANPDGVWVDAERDRFEADALVITAGAWTGQILSELGLPIEVRRKTLWWQRVLDPEPYRPERFPVFITDSPDGEIYGFPVFGAAGLKIANHAGGEPTTVDSVDRATRPGENRDCVQLAAQLLPGVMPDVVKSAVCLYSMTPDTDFIVDRDPRSPRVAFAAGFSGHGFKFAPAIGELLAELIVNPRAEPAPRLRFSRFAHAAPQLRAPV
ncbi:MAG: N-methyl-L-tryptophan oxidase [Thermomicrobiales bacterium]